MSKIYEVAPPEVQNIVERVMQTYHTELYDLEVKVATTMVSKMDAEDHLVPCLKLHGNLAAAIIRLIRGSQRIRVEHDAEILIDKAQWDDFSSAQREALIDHELNHLLITKDRLGVPKTDDRGHLKLRMKPDDFALTGFYAIVRRHGENAVEFGSVTRTAAAMAEALAAYQADRAQPTAPPTPAPVTAAPEVPAVPA